MRKFASPKNVIPLAFDVKKNQGGTVNYPVSLHLTELKEPRREFNFGLSPESHVDSK